MDAVPHTSDRELTQVFQLPTRDACLYSNNSTFDTTLDFTYVRITTSVVHCRLQELRMAQLVIDESCMTPVHLIDKRHSGGVVHCESALGGGPNACGLEEEAAGRLKLHAWTAYQCLDHQRLCICL